MTSLKTWRQKKYKNKIKSYKSWSRTGHIIARSEINFLPSKLQNVTIILKKSRNIAHCTSSTLHTPVYFNISAMFDKPPSSLPS